MRTIVKKASRYELWAKSALFTVAVAAISVAVLPGNLIHLSPALTDLVISNCASVFLASVLVYLGFDMWLAGCRRHTERGGEPMAIDGNP